MDERYVDECEEPAVALVPGWLDATLRTALADSVMGRLLDPACPLDEAGIRAAVRAGMRDAVAVAAMELFAAERDVCARRGIGAHRYQALCADLRPGREDGITKEYHFAVTPDLFEKHVQWRLAHPHVSQHACQERLDGDLRSMLHAVGWLGPHAR